MSLFNKISLALSISLLGVISGQAQSFECPVSQVPAQQAAATNKLLPLLENFRNNAKVATAIETLRNDRDGTVQVVNSLIAAYCRLVASEQGTTDAQKSAEVRKFGLNVTRQAFSLSSEEMVILDVELSPKIVEKITSKATADGISPQEWIAIKINTDLAQ